MDPERIRGGPSEDAPGGRRRRHGVEVNYATFGLLVGHELIHVAESYMFDAQGRTRNYWDRPTSSQAQLGCVAKRLDAASVSGEQCKEETSADFGGLRMAYDALAAQLGADRLRTVGPDGRTLEQRFFLAFAEDHCTQMTRVYAAESAKADPP